MARIIRLTERDLTRLVRRVINEDQEAQKQQLQAKVTSCFDKKRFPHLNLLMESSGLGIMAIAGAALTVASVGVSAGVSAGIFATATLIGGAIAIEKAVLAFKSDKNGGLMSEAKDFAKCITGY